MAARDVREYFFTMLLHYLEEKQNLQDFEEALKDGLITEDQLQEAMTTVTELEQNYYRLAYVMFLLDMPNKKAKKPKYLSQQKLVLDEFKRLGVDIDSIKQKNTDALLHFKECLKALKNKDEQI